MAETSDFFALLAAIGGKAGLFPAGGNLARKAVNEIVRAQLVADGTDLEALRTIRALLGPAAFAEALDGVPAPKTKALLARVDPNAPALAQPGDRVKALLALADASRDPAAPVAKPAKKASSRKVSATAPATPSAPPPEAVPADGKPAPRKRKITGRTALRVSEER